MDKMPAIQASPDLLGNDGRLRLVAGFIADLQKQLFELDLLQTANTASDDMPIPGANGMTYGSHRATLMLGIQEVELKFTDEIAALHNKD